MPFDRAHEERRAFRRWTTAERERLAASGIPLAFWESYENWRYFLEHSDLPYEGDPGRFDLAELSSVQLEELTGLIRSWRNDESETDAERRILAIQRSRLKAEHEDLFDDLAAYFLDADPMERNLGSYGDEYEPEVGTILPRVRGLDSVAPIAAVLRQELARWWNRDIRSDGPSYEEMAAGVLTILERHRPRWR